MFKIVALIASGIVILLGYMMLIPIILAIGLIMLDKTVIMSTRYVSRYVLEITSFSVVLIGLIYGYVIGFFFAAVAPVLISFIAYSAIKQGKGITEMDVIFSSENIVLVMVGIIASFLSFMPFVMAVVLLVGLKLALVAVKDMFFGRMPNIIAIAVTLIIAFYIAQFLESYAVQVAGVVI